MYSCVTIDTHVLVILEKTDVEMNFVGTSFLLAEQQSFCFVLKKIFVNRLQNRCLLFIKCATITFFAVKCLCTSFLFAITEVSGF